MVVTVKTCLLLWIIMNVLNIILCNKLIESVIFLEIIIYSMFAIYSLIKNTYKGLAIIKQTNYFL